jgi:hypothetical protein
MRRIILFIVLAGLMLTCLVSFATERQSKPMQSSASPSKTAQNAPSPATAVFEKVSKSVVIVEAQTPDGTVQGSGVVYDITFFSTQGTELLGNADKPRVDSLIVTNAHVIRNGNAVSALQGGKRYQAAVEYVNSEFDLAFLYVRGVMLPFSSPFPGSHLAVGEKVFAIGSPLGLENSISEGIISGKRQENGVLLLQTTAAISKGNSGGGLFDAKGRLVGITTFRLRGGENLNFAVDAGCVSEFDIARSPINILRFAASISLPGLSPDQMGIINSPTFVEWLLKARDEQGEKVYIKLARELEEQKKNRGAKADSPAIWTLFADECMQILNQFLSDQAGKTGSAPDRSEKEAIVCSFPDGYGNRRDEVHHIDYANSTVDGNPAHFTDAEISWANSWDPGEHRQFQEYGLRPGENRIEMQYVLNRYSGLIKETVGVREVASSRFRKHAGPIDGQCSPATERKF